MKKLTPTQIRFLRAQAHHLRPLVLVGDGGLSDAVLKEIAATIKAHELIKIKVANDERSEREAMLSTICESVGAAAVQHIGKTLLVYKPAAEAKIKLPLK
jgi:RNA-binding protein